MDNQQYRWIYDTDSSNRYRYSLGKASANMLMCIGVNPSKAEPGSYDGTVASVERIADYNGYSGWIMVNLYPQRATNPKDIHVRNQRKYHLENIEWISRYVNRVQDIWCAWGNLIDSRSFFMSNLQTLYNSIHHENINWLRAGKLLKKGHPRHPLYLPRNSKLESFDMEFYLKNKLQ